MPKDRKPNLQNIHISTVDGRRVREAFIAPPGSRIVSADYSQIELRLMTHPLDTAVEDDCDLGKEK